MSDYERYGDYDDIEEDLPKSKNPVIIALKIMIFIVCAGVIGLIAFRMIAFNTYPKSVKNVYFNEILKEHYDENDGNIEIKTQKLRAPYDDEEEGNFFCDYLYVIDDIDQLQITVRYNTATVEKIAEELGVELDENADDLFTYSLYASYGEDMGKTAADKPSDEIFDKKLRYRYEKLVFDDVDLSLDGIGSPYWIRLEIRIKGYEDKGVYMIPIYENNEKFSTFKDYKLSGKEKP
ncbi:MAG: hypothetical protein E7673_05570 [Ruminococcaceae bacterium]|nr:hypothetical protein [Oscillospiraceae bacterium]